MMKRKTGIRTLLLCLCMMLLCTTTVFAVQPTEDGEYSIEIEMSGGSGKASVETPALLIRKDGQYFVKLTWSSSNYDYMIVDGEKYLNQSEEDANSTFIVPITAMDEDVVYIADTLAMGTPHEIEYTFCFYESSIGSKSKLPEEGAKRVLIMAAIMIVGGGILNHILKKRREQDYTGKRSR